MTWPTLVPSGMDILSTMLNTMYYPCRVQKTNEYMTKITLADPYVVYGYLQKNISIGSTEKTCSTMDNANMVIFVKPFGEEKFSVRVSLSTTVADLKLALQDRVKSAVARMRLIFSGRRLCDSRTLDDYDVYRGSTIHLLLLDFRKGAPSDFVLPLDLIDSNFNCDFRKVNDHGIQFFRGGFPYSRPCGFMRYALKVIGKYADDVWLEGTERRTEKTCSAPGEWAVSYHGTSYHNGLSIVQDGFRLSKGKRFSHGVGVYTTPDIEVALVYSQQIRWNDSTYKVVIQNRVNPATFVRVSKEETGVGEFWVHADQQDVRPYGFCAIQV